MARSKRSKSSELLGRVLLGLFRRFLFIRITEYTEYQFPKEQTLCYSENRIADVAKIKAMRPRKSGYAIFSPAKDGRKLPKGHNYRLFCHSEQTAIPSILLSGGDIPFISESE